MHYVLFAFLSLALLLAVVALTRERRLRMALQQILIRILKRWGSNENTQSTRPSDRHDATDDIDRV